MFFLSNLVFSCERDFIDDSRQLRSERVSNVFIFFFLLGLGEEIGIYTTASAARAPVASLARKRLAGDESRWDCLFGLASLYIPSQFQEELYV